MGTYNQSGEEIYDKFKKFLEEASLGEGDISAYAIAEAWNKLAHKMKWSDRLLALDVEDMKNMIQGREY